MGLSNNGKHKSLVDRAYAIISGDDRHDRGCTPIQASDCTDSKRNYVLNVLNGAAGKLAEQVVSAKFALPWLMTAIGAPTFLNRSGR